MPSPASYSRLFVSRLAFALRLAFLGVLTLLFAIALCITHPIFVFTTAFSLTISSTKIAFALLKRWIKGEPIFSPGEHRVIIVNDFREVSSSEGKAAEHETLENVIEAVERPHLSPTPLSPAFGSNSSKIIELSKSEYFSES